MKIKQVIIGCKKSRNFQTYECTEVIDLEEGDEVGYVKREAQARCRKAVMEQFEIDK